MSNLAGGEMTETNPCGKRSATNGMWLLGWSAMVAVCKSFRNLPILLIFNNY